jgi:hypothetical protein
MHVKRWNYLVEADAKLTKALRAAKNDGTVEAFVDYARSLRKYHSSEDSFIDQLVQDIGVQQTILVLKQEDTTTEAQVIRVIETGIKPKVDKAYTMSLRLVSKVIKDGRRRTDKELVLTRGPHHNIYRNLLRARIHLHKKPQDQPVPPAYTGQRVTDEIDVLLVVDFSTPAFKEIEDIHIMWDALHLDDSEAAESPTWKATKAIGRYLMRTLGGTLYVDYRAGE